MASQADFAPSNREFNKKETRRKLERFSRDYRGGAMMTQKVETVHSAEGLFVRTDKTTLKKSFFA